MASLQGMTPMVRKRKEDREMLTLWKQLRDLKAIEESKQLVRGSGTGSGVGEGGRGDERERATEIGEEEGFVRSGRSGTRAFLWAHASTLRGRALRQPEARPTHRTAATPAGP